MAARRQVRRWWQRLSILLGLGVMACGTEPEPDGGLHVVLLTSGEDVDLDGYMLVVDGTQRSVSPQELVELGSLRAGRHQIELRGVAANCDVAGTTAREVQIDPGQLTEVAFAVACYATGLELQVTTSGSDGPASYTLRFGSQLVGVLSNGPYRQTRLEPGTYALALSGVPFNCGLETVLPPTVLVRAREVTHVGATIRCNAASGVLELLAVTTGMDPDPNGYQVQVGENVRLTIPSNDTTVTLVPVGSYAVRLEGVASNCAVQASNPQSAVFRAGGSTRDTVLLRFDISCVAIEKLAYVEGQTVKVAYADGSNPITIATGAAPDWSPQGTTLVYQLISCSAAVANYGGGEPPPPSCTPKGLALATPGATAQSWLTIDPSDRDPAWSPDGQRIAFERDGQLWLIRPDGTGLTALPTPTLTAGYPAWSPSGDRLAFACEVELGNHDICAINLDGTGFERLTDDPGFDGAPDWSPDDSRIVFNTCRFSGRTDVAVLNLASRTVTRVVEGLLPAWSHDGARIVLGIDGIGLAIVQPDGSGLQVISHQGGYAPDWRP